ncbi:acetylornithine deacetylase/succinyl-diaminopimelate desuccinylase-like protein [Branchiibius hedensis]|uniref:Acetylornithine deacetylase/Succinyl-diaminopimelate desuccinylase n=1 Tax=Branchiibius hedensis TaxID=672460 RepID=A0A2Y8ZQ66_9MICO|nr:M20/M25/M40 family metallo-hydrolase [Branchiibius hedensis]PWJ25169.1 acetylornithine deacetylase/succinyl-diaminopimelate desuccinylase-like protein [Branchiibius hedensis]SSA33984.1 Acetylornithine deacetylase/Succinyl-diaminopimelate desuccinylase [Branchiibius hedensis]
MTDQPTALDEVVQICQDLIAFDTSNFGDGSGPGERKAAEYVVGQFEEVGLEPVIIESDPGRASVVVRIPGEDSDRGALVVHGHLDVVPATASDWQVDPFGAEIKDGCIWGRGAVDMKDMDAMIIANVRELARTGRKPARDLVIALFADEEAGGAKGSHHLVANHPELFEGATEAISEVGGYSITFPNAAGREQRAYLLQSAEKGLAWLTLRATGRAGHGSVPNPDNAVMHLAQALTRISEHPWPRQYGATVRALLDGLAQLSGRSYTDEDPEPVLELLGSTRGFVDATLQDTVNATMLDAGYKHNVIPQTATAGIDCRFLPGHEEELMATLRDLAGEHITIETVHRDIAVEAPYDTDLVEAMKRSLLAEDPEAAILPYCLSAGTDNKALSLLGIKGYGFTPLRLPADLDFAAMFHGVDERVPVDSLLFGTRVLGRLLQDC